MLHGHCQQKALVGISDTTAVLKRLPGVDVTELDSGCCGMAGSFGYELGHYDLSVALANRVILPVSTRMALMDTKRGHVERRRDLANQFAATTKLPAPVLGRYDAVQAIT